MSISLQVPKPVDLKPRITVIGVGGAGGNAVNNMIAAGLSGVEFIVANTDAQALLSSKAANRIQLGVHLTEGLGAGSKPEIGEAAAKEAEEELRARLIGCHMLFIAAGMGGGTGTGATSVIARVARDLGILTIAVVTKPFTFEGTKRMRSADAGIVELRSHVDTLIVIPNQNLFRIANEKTTFSEAFLLADQVLYSGIACIVDLIVKDGLINLDLADVRTVLTGMGPAVMGTGEAAGDRRAVMAAEEAISNQLLDNMSLTGARGLLLSIIGGPDMTLYEVDEAASRVRAELDPDANIIIGAAFDESMKDRVRVSIVASGMPVAASQIVPPAAKPAPSAVPRPAQSTAQPTAQPAPQSAPAAIAAANFWEAAAASASAPTPPLPRAPVGPPPLPPSATTVDRGADGLRIRESLSSASAGAATSTADLSRAHPTANESVYVAPDTFEPKQLVEPRRAGQRIPEISDFPPIGQKEYRDKIGRVQAAQQAGEQTVVPAPVMQRAEPTKGKLFQRLAEVALGRSRQNAEVDAGSKQDALPEFFARDRRA